MISAAGPYGGGDDFVIIYLKKITSALKKGLKNYYEVSENAVISNAKMTLGNLTWLHLADQEIQPLSVAYGKLTGSRINTEGERVFMMRW